MRGRVLSPLRLTPWTGVNHGWRYALQSQSRAYSVKERRGPTDSALADSKQAPKENGLKQTLEKAGFQINSTDQNYLNKLHKAVDSEPHRSKPENNVQLDPNGPVLAPTGSNYFTFATREIAMNRHAAKKAARDSRTVKEAASMEDGKHSDAIRHVVDAPLFKPKSKRKEILQSRSQSFSTGPAENFKGSLDQENGEENGEPSAAEQHTVPRVQLQNQDAGSVTEGDTEHGFRKVLARVVTNATMINNGWWRTIPPAYLRDCCTCEACVDPYSKQKNFQTTDIPDDIAVRDINTSQDGTVQITWNNDIPEYSKHHTTILEVDFFKHHSAPYTMAKALSERELPGLWDKKQLTQSIKRIGYETILNHENESALWLALQELLARGIVIIQNVPTDEESVVKIAERIGTLRDSFYGRTWDVKSKPKAANVAYTSKYLGLHMDLLYMAEPPAFQFLHCMKNTAEGGESIFSDSFHAASKLNDEDFGYLASGKIRYHYHNDGQHYNYRHPVIKLKTSGIRSQIECINYSPPFQGNFAMPDRHYAGFTKALKSFAAGVESEENIYECKLGEGECVIFNNRRVLHGRRQFSMNGGERWLRGCYVDADVFMIDFGAWKKPLVQKVGNLSNLENDNASLASNEQRSLG